MYGNLYLTTRYFGLFPASAECSLFELDICPRTSKRSAKCFSPAFNGLSLQVETNFTLNRPSPESFLCNLPDSRRHVTRPNQGLSSLAPGGEKRRDLGMRERPVNLIAFHIHGSTATVFLSGNHTPSKVTNQDLAGRFLLFYNQSSPDDPLLNLFPIFSLLVAAANEYQCKGIYVLLRTEQRAEI